MDGGHGEQYEDQAPKGSQADHQQPAVLRGLLSTLKVESIDPPGLLGMESI
jgi:hypothetical protein